MINAEGKSTNELAEDRTDLAVERTAMAANRTLMAWVRTATSLISFGFTIYKFLQAATAGAQAEGARLSLLKEQGPKRLGLFLIALGTMAVIMGTVEYVHTVQSLNKQSRSPRRLFNFSVVMGLLIGLLGLFLFITILANAEVF